ncbi:MULTISPECIES: sodium-dependent transporter [unclassified Corynebacterium]|uniref:sodium-dependent transporter n=1 Tax=unclassified Corynebacterium TaxID=2624378 RepID=UPI0008A5D91F|nr:MULTISPECIES: sodium-dependent transporter [unclassified Corynebacterium]OFN35818.1 SNF family Na(+)-dependent transporter [Corynebacterium sp. HMSC072A04]OFN77594.1 SNF family Na(+)-dependent transporter [Corynebacterium sp. HMSC070E08]
MTTSTPHKTRSTRDTFNTRFVFLMAAIGSAVGLGNIWRFPYVAYENGGGAFLIPYMVALLTAGIPILWFDLAIGHRFRGSAPLAFRRISSRWEGIGWFKVGVNFFIAIYYAAIIAWAALYTIKSLQQTWGEDPSTYFMVDFLQADAEATYSGHVVPSILGVMILVWVVCIATLATSINKGIGKLTSIFLPVLAVMFIILVIRAFFLDGAAEGLNAFFTPDWSVLSNPSVWIAAYGQIFFSLSIGFGIMITYASYLKPRTNLTNTGLVTAFANSSFEVLAGIGVFATLGYMAAQQGVSVDEVAESGIGLAFIAFPTIINLMPLGWLFGVLFFGSLFLAGVTSLISIMEVVVSAVADKFNISRRVSAISVGSAMGVLSCFLFATSSGLVTLDIMDKFTNNLGIVFGAICALVVVGWVTGRRREIQQHINAVSQFKVGGFWQFLTFVATPLLLVYFLVNEIITIVREGYEGYSSTQIGLFGWAVLGVILLVSFVMPLVDFRGNKYLDGIETSDYGVPVGGRPAGTPNPLATGNAAAPNTDDK